MRIVTLRLDDALVGRVDAEVGGRGRSEWIRSAIEAALSVSKPVPSEAKVCKKGRCGVLRRNAAALERPIIPTSSVLPRHQEQLTKDDADFLSKVLAIGGRPTERSVRQDLGWNELRASKALRRLLSAGKVSVTGGSIEVLE